MNLDSAKLRTPQIGNLSKDQGRQKTRGQSGAKKATYVASLTREWVPQSTGDFVQNTVARLPYIITVHI